MPETFLNSLNQLSEGSKENSGSSDTSDCENDNILKELCFSNGLPYHHLDRGEGTSVYELEMFFSGFPRIIRMNHFPNLFKIIIINQNIKMIENLDLLIFLEELWICECRIKHPGCWNIIEKKIENLSNCKVLTKLYLYCNEIETIENLDGLSYLEVLWLNSNKIKIIQNLSELSRLKELQLAENQIETIGHSLDANQKLESVNLSGNRIRFLKDLIHLARLKNLKTLSMKDSLYTPSPVALLCNYYTHVLYHLPHLECLDSFDVTSRTLSDVAYGIVQRKKIFYKMKAKKVEHQRTQCLIKMDKLKEALLHQPHDITKAFVCAIKEIYRQLEEHKGISPNEEFHNSDTECDRDTKGAQVTAKQLTKDSLEEKLKKLERGCSLWNSKCKRYQQQYEDAVAQEEKTYKMMMRRIELEFQTGANVKFEDGTKNDSWFNSCHELLLSRFCASDFKQYNIYGLEVQRITRVHNRMLHARLESKLATLAFNPLEEYYPGSIKNNYNKYFEYLFWIWDPGLPGGSHEPLRILEDGFMEADVYQKLGQHAAVPLSNCLSLAERRRIKYLKNISSVKDKSNSCLFRHGQVVVTKVYLGRSVLASDNKLITKADYPYDNSVFKPKRMFIGIEKDILDGEDQKQCDCIDHQCEWYIFDHELVVPEYIIDFKYLSLGIDDNPFIFMDQNSLVDIKSQEISDEFEKDYEKILSEFTANSVPTLFTCDMLLTLGRTLSFAAVKYLNLHQQNINNLRVLRFCKALQKLILTCNNLTRLDALADMDLEYLDVSYNKISTLDGMKNLNKLTFFNISWNELTNTKEELNFLKKYVPNVMILDVRNNKWLKPKALRLKLIGRLKSLTLLNSIPVTEAEAATALRMVAGSRISQVSLLAHARTDTEKPRVLTLENSAKTLSLTRNKPEQKGDKDLLWFSTVTSLNLNGQHLTKISGLERLDNLKWASFNDNELSKIEGLDACSKLEELCLQGNCISHLDGISKLSSLKSLHIGYNYITLLEGSGIQNLSLTYLSLEYNRITSLAGLDSLYSLIELYLGGNKIVCAREVLHIKNLSELLILDLSDNPLTTEAENYRLYVIYHLKSVKALDALPVSVSEVSRAREIFGGRLTIDFITERVGRTNVADLMELDLPNCNLRSVYVGDGECFVNLRSINLEHNNLTSFGGLINLKHLRVLCLNYNHIECIVPKSKAPEKSRLGDSESSLVVVDLTPESCTPVLEKLEVLHLGYNGIKNMAALHLSRLPSLKALFLQGNEISKMNGMEGLIELQELVLDGNKIRNLSESTLPCNLKLQELHLDENRIRELSNISNLRNLKKLFLGYNRIQDLLELEKLSPLKRLTEVSFSSNMVAKKPQMRLQLIFQMPQLQVINNIPVTADEKAKAKIYFLEQQMLVESQTMPEVVLPGINNNRAQMPIKVTNVQLTSPTNWGMNMEGGMSQESFNKEGMTGRFSDPRRHVVGSGGFNSRRGLGSIHHLHRHQTSSSANICQGARPGQRLNSISQSSHSAETNIGQQNHR